MPTFDNQFHTIYRLGLIKKNKGRSGSDKSSQGITLEYPKHSTVLGLGLGLRLGL